MFSRKMNEHHMDTNFKASDRKATSSLVAAVFCGATFMVGTPALADNILGYWRFEPGAFLEDSSGNGNHLANFGRAIEDKQVSSGGFPQTIAATGEPNTQAASFDGTGDYFSVDPDELGILGANAFTIESFIRMDSHSSAVALFGVYDTSGSNRSWQIQVRADRSLEFWGSENGSTFTSWPVGGRDVPLFQVDTDYYFAMAIDLDDDGNEAMSVYIQNLVTGDMQEFHRSALNISGFNADTTAPFLIGGRGTGLWNGLVDEVRLSSGKLTPDQFMIVPEPASLALLGIGGLILLKRRRA